MEQNTYEPRTIQVVPEELKASQAKYMSKVYGWMSLALVVTGLIAYLVSESPALINAIILNKLLFYGLIFAELGLVIWLSTRIAKMSVATAITAFMGYAVLNGLTLSVIFLAYTLTSITSTFLLLQVHLL